MNDFVGTQAGIAIFWTLASLFALVVLLLIIRVLKSIAKQRYENDPARRPRLAIMDAVTVDNNRRLVLVRRDDIEHLVMIGGPNDLTIETKIGRASTMQRPHQPNINQDQGRSHISTANNPKTTVTNEAPDSVVMVEKRAQGQRSSADTSVNADMRATDTRNSTMQTQKSKDVQPKVDDEMDRLLGELSNHRQ